MKAIKQGSSAKDVVITAITALEVEVTAHLNPDIDEIAISMIQVRRYMASTGYFYNSFSSLDNTLCVFVRGEGYYQTLDLTLCDIPEDLLQLRLNT